MCFAKVERRTVDRFSDHDVFLPCVVRAEWADGGDSPPQPLFCKLKFHGAAEGFDFITIESPPVLSCDTTSKTSFFVVVILKVFRP